MQVVPTEIPEVKEIRPVRHHDPRGFFSEIFRESVLRENGIDATFVQENHSLSLERGVIRGLHFQIPPASQAKLVRVGGRIDFRCRGRHPPGSPTYGRHVAVVLSAARGQPAVRAGRVRARLLHAGAEYRGGLQGQPLLLARRTIAGWPGTIRRSASPGRYRARQALLSDKDRRQPVSGRTAGAISATTGPRYASAMKLLVLGAGGQVGHELCRPRWPAGYRVAALRRGEARHHAARGGGRGDGSRAAGHRRQRRRLYRGRPRRERARCGLGRQLHRTRPISPPPAATPASR